MIRSALLALALCATACTASAVRQSATVLRADLEDFTALSAPAEGATAAVWSAARDSLMEHAHELEQLTRD